LYLSLFNSQSLALEQRQTPAALGALPVDVLLAHFVPHNIVIGEGPPSLADL
jgi:hypothetical protein